MLNRPVAWLLAYLAFVVYGSLVPLEFHALPPSDAWARFQRIPFLQLGVESRADWITNGVLYLPLGFLGTWVALRRGWVRVAAAAVAIGGALALALAVEYAQLFFPPRTVSLNDLLAEAVGSIFGSALAVATWSARSRWQPLPHLGADWLHHRALPLYAALYLAYSLFPYDFLISGAELSLKLASAGWGWWLADGDTRRLVTFARLGAELMLAAPLGAWLAVRRPAFSWPLAFAAGLAIGLALELVQLLLASGVTQGASSVARAGGVALGAMLWRQRAAWTVERARSTARRAAPWLLLPYLLLLLGVNGWFSRAWAGTAHAAETLAGLRWQPFYYHYYTSEAQALLSLTSVALAYAPIGIVVWARGASALAAALTAGALAALVEAGKLFLPGLRPDPTNLAIAAAAAGGVVWAAAHLARARRPTPINALRDRVAAAVPAQAPHGSTRVARDARTLPRGSTGLWLLAAAALAWQLFSAPPLVAATTLGALAAAAAIAVRPALSIVLLVAALPLWDFAPWTGRLLWDEFDLLLALGLAVAWARTPAPTRPAPALWQLPFVLLSASLIVSAAIGFWPGAALDANALASYHSPYNALRIVKGLLWASLAIGLWRRLEAAGHVPAELFARGMVIGLAGVVAWVLWERWAFAGFDPGVPYRVTGPFSAMHRGGAFIECYIAVAVPFAAQAVLDANRTWLKAALGGLVIAASVAMMLTFSRNGYVALAIALSAWAVMALRARARGGALRIAVPALLAAVAAAAWPVLSGPYAQARLAQWERDLGLRVAHWQDALALRDGSIAETLFGAGLGRFPSLHLWRSREDQRAAQLRVERDGLASGDAPASFLRLGSGSPTYLDQLVRLGSAEEARLDVTLRARTAGQPLSVSLCEKWMLTSATCVAARLEAGPSGAWTTTGAMLDLRPLAQSSGRPIKFAIHAPTSGAAIDVGRLSLKAADGRELVANGDFARGFDGWWMSTDADPPYHVHSLPVAVLLEQGWVGVLAWGMLLALAASAGAVAAWRGRSTSAGPTAALTAFGVSATLNTLADDPRFVLLLLTVAWSCVAVHHSRVTHGA